MMYSQTWLPGAVYRCIHACEEEAWLIVLVDSAVPQSCPLQNILASFPL